LTVIGEGEFQYEVMENWGELPDGWSLDDVADIGIDSRGRAFVFNRGPHPMIVFDREGRFLRSWGEGLFRSPHAVHVAPDDTIFCTDDGDHTVRRMSADGRVLLQIGVPGQPSPYMSGSPFHRCTHTALSPSGEIYVSDGYGNARIHKFSESGRLLHSWGSPGTRPGQFNVPHNICCDRSGAVYVADRENHRIQVFDGHGRYRDQWNNLHRPCGLCMQEKGSRRTFYVTELAPQLAINRRVPNLGPRMSVLDDSGRLLATVGEALAGPGPTRFVSPHGLAVDANDDVYVGQLAKSVWPRLFPDEPPPPRLSALTKLVRTNKP
jgi:DNA-binding beta-propeller fold protein YncE